MTELEKIMKMSGEELDKACYEKLHIMESDIDNAVKYVNEHLEVFLMLTNHVTTITTLDREEYDEFLKSVQDYADECDSFMNMYESEYENDIVARTLRLLALNAQFEKLSEKLKSAIGYTVKIEERLDSGNFCNAHFVPLIQLVWNKFSDEIDQFSYDNLDEQSSNNQPWLVVDTSDVVYIQSFPSKTDAQKYVMQHKGLNGKNIVCRY